MDHGQHEQVAAPVAGAAPGWYRDPWGYGYRYWDGMEWTAAAFADVPQPDTASAPFPSAASYQPPPSRPAGAVPPPDWAWPAPEPPTVVGPPLDAAAPAAGGSGRRRVAVTLVVVGLVAGLTGVAAGAAIADARRPGRTTAAGASPSPSPSLPRRPGFPAPTVPTPAVPTPADPASASLESLVLHQGDVPDSLTVATIPGGTRVVGEVTLDLCDGTFPSEDLRTARLQVAAGDGQGRSVLSTEAVLYRDLGATEQGFSELRSAASGCPAETARFNPAPDGPWPQTPTVDRLAFDFVATDASGQQTHAVAVYLRRGRALLALYFTQPDAVPAVNGSTDMGAIVGQFAGRLAALPASVVGQ